MKSFFPLLAVALAGCQAPAPLPLPQPSTEPKPITTVAPRIAEPAPAPTLQPHQLIEALLSQNDALTAQLKAVAAVPSPVTATPSPIAAGPTSSLPTPATPPKTEIVPVVPEPMDPILVPNAEGVIDVTAAKAAPTDEPTNPFAVRTAPAGVPDLVLKVQGLIGTRCALVNDRALSVGDKVEALTFERIDANALVFRTGKFLLKVPVGEAPIKVRGAL
ncbi:MAG: hypothetical protein JWM32_1277 [Verrucomicrobia bacterium]|nr:hypothetical protein [Verrucomicrobiota bacterium]